MEGELYVEVTESAPAFVNVLTFYVNWSFTIGNFHWHNLRDGLIKTSELGRAKVFIPIAQIRDVPDDNCIVSGWEPALNICPRDGDDQ